MTARPAIWILVFAGTFLFWAAVAYFATLTALLIGLVCFLVFLGFWATR